jgi:hypothetical protein
MMTNNQTLLLSLYENPLAAGAIPAALAAETACHDRLIGYLLGGGVNDESANELATVESLPNLPPRADMEFSPVYSLPHVPPRALDFSPVHSLPNLPPRAHVGFSPVHSLPNLPPRAHMEFAPVVSIPVIPPRA